MIKHDFMQVLETGVINDFNEIISYLQENPEDILLKSNNGIQILHIIVALKKFDVKLKILEIINNYKGNDAELLVVKNKIQNIKSISEKVQSDLDSQLPDVNEAMECIIYGSENEYRNLKLDELAFWAAAYNNLQVYGILVVLGFEIIENKEEKYLNTIKKYEQDNNVSLFYNIRINILSALSLLLAANNNDDGIKYFNNDQYNEAIQFYKKDIERNPYNAIYHNNLGNVYYAIGRVDEAIQEYRSAAGLDPNNATYRNNLGNIFYDIDRYNAAIEEYIRAIRIDLRNATYHNNLGNAYYAIGRNNEAIEEYIRAIELDSDNATYHNNLGNAYYVIGRYNYAAKSYQRAVDLDLWNEKYETNLEMARNIESISSLNMFAPVGLFGCFCEKIDERRMKVDVNSSRYLFDLGIKYLKKKDYGRANTHFRELIERNPNKNEYYLGLGDTYYAVGEYDEAIKAYRKAIEIYRANLEHDNNYRANKGAYYDYERSNYQITYHYYYEAGIKTIAYYYECIAKAFYAAKQYDNAIREYIRAVELMPHKSVYHNNLAKVFYAAKQYDNAIREYRIAIYIEARKVKNPDIYGYSDKEFYAECYSELGAVYFAIGQYDEANRAYRGAVELAPNESSYHNNLGNAFYAARQYANAVEAYKNAIKLDPHNTMYHHNLSNAYCNNKQYFNSFIELMR